MERIKRVEIPVENERSTINEFLGNEEVPLRRWDLVQAFFGRNVSLGVRYEINGRRLLRRSDRDLKIVAGIVDLLLEERFGKGVLEPQVFPSNDDEVAP